MLAFKIIKIAKLLLSNKNYFKLPKNLHKDIFNKFKKYLNENLNKNTPHIVIIVNKEELKQYCQNYKYQIDTNIAKDIQILFLNPLNVEKNFIGDNTTISNKMLKAVNILATNMAIKGLTKDNGQTIIIQNSKQFNIQSTLQHQLIHAIRMMFNLTNTIYNNENNFFKQIIRYFLTDKQYPSLITDCCYQIKTIQQFNEILNIINKIYTFNIQQLYEITSNLKYGQHILFLSLLKKYKKHKYNNAITFIIQDIKKNK